LEQIGKPKMSKLQEWIDRKTAYASAPEGPVPRGRVTVRLRPEPYYKLLQIASALRITQTLCLEEIAERAIDDVWAGMGRGPVDRDEIRDLMARLQKKKESGV
jgi:hypothetical protein